MHHGYFYVTLFLALILGAHDGFVALWTSPGGEPEYIFPYSVSSLPPEDQKRLEEGIEIGSREELMSILEDYLS